MNKNKFHSLKITLFFGFLVSAVFFAGCKSNPEKTTIVAQPKTPAVKTVTSFTPALKCMDRMFSRYNKNDIIITSSGLPDATGKIQTGTKEMMISAISKMSVRSNAFRFVDYDPTQYGVQELHDLIGIRTDLGFDVPRYYIRGAITQLDSGVTSDSMGFGIGLPKFSLGYQSDQVVSVIAMDLNMADMISRQILPGLFATNSIAVIRSGKGGDVDAKIGKANLFFNMSQDRQEGTHTSVRNLVELSLIEILGKLTKVPYWRCLDVPNTNPLMISQARDWYDAMKRDEQIRLIQSTLIQNGYMPGTATGSMDSNTRNAVGRYQAENNLVASGRVDFDLYYSLLLADLIITDANPEAKDVKKVTHNVQKLSLPVSLTLTTPTGKNPILRRGQKLKLIAGVSESAYLYCYYQDGQNQLARIFPNRFNPDAYVAGGKTIRIPSQDTPFDLVMETSGAHEKVSCLASRREIGVGLPPELLVEDLTPIKGNQLNDVINAYRRADSTSLSVKTISITVQ